MSRLLWHIGQPVTIICAPALSASARIAAERSTTASVLARLNAPPQHSVAKFQGTASHPAARIAASIPVGFSASSPSMIPSPRLSRHP